MKTAIQPATVVKQKPGLLINRNFALLWVGQAISVVGDGVFDATLALWIVTQVASNRPWAPLAVSGVFLALSLPPLIAGPLAGPFVDRWNKRQTMLCMDAFRTLLILLLILATGLLSLPSLSHSQSSIFWQLGIIYSVVLLASVCAQFFEPSSMALIGSIVEEPLRARASGLNQVTMSLAIIIGPPLAALIFFGLGVQWALLLNACSFAASFLALLAMRVPRERQTSRAEGQKQFRHAFREGLRFYFGNRVLMTLLIAGIFLEFGSGAINTLNIFFITQNLHTPIQFYGFLSPIFGAGAIIGAISAGLFAQRIGVAKMLWLSVIGTGILVLIFARLTNLVPALGILFLLGIVITSASVAIMPLLLHVTPQELVGRVTSVLNPTMSLASVISVALVGYLDSTLLHNLHLNLFGLALGPVDTIFSGAGLCFVLSGFYIMVGLRGVTLKSLPDNPPVESR